MRWRGDWSGETEYAAGDVVRAAYGSGIYIAVGASRGREPAVDLQHWQVLLSIDSLTRGPCPSGMVRLPNHVCMDETRRLYTAEGGDPSRFYPAYAMQLCHETGARLCGFEELKLRALCLNSPDSCQVDQAWQRVDPSPVLWCDPLVYLPASSFLNHEDHTLRDGKFVDDLGGYVTVEANQRGPRLAIDLKSWTRAACADRWEREGGAAYLCCQDP